MWELAEQYLQTLSAGLCGVHNSAKLRVRSKQPTNWANKMLDLQLRQGPFSQDITVYSPVPQCWAWTSWMNGPVLADSVCGTKHPDPENRGPDALTILNAELFNPSSDCRNNMSLVNRIPRVNYDNSQYYIT